MVVRGRSLWKRGKKSEFTRAGETKFCGALRIITISNCWPQVGHCRLVCPRLSKWPKLMSRQSFQFFSPIPKHSYCWMCQNDVLEWSGMILSGFGNVLIGNTMATCLESNYQVNKMHSCKLMFFSCFKLQLGVEFLPSIIARIFCRNHL